MCFAFFEVGEGSSSVRIGSAPGFEMKTAQKHPWVLRSGWKIQHRHSDFGDLSIVVTFPLSTCIHGPNTDFILLPRLVQTLRGSEASLSLQPGLEPCPSAGHEHLREAPCPLLRPPAL